MDTPPFDVELFIKEVKRHPVLWDSKHPNFNHRKAKTSSWEEVALNLFPDSENWSNYDKFGKVRDIQKRWKNMRDNYVKEVRYEKKVQQGLAVAKRKRYIYAHLLEFLSPEKKLPSKSSSEKSSSSEDEEEMEEDDTKDKSSESYMLMDEGYSSSHVNQFCKTSLGGSQNHLSGSLTDHQYHSNSPEQSGNASALRNNPESNSYPSCTQQYSLRNVPDSHSRTDFTTSQYSQKPFSEPTSSRIVPEPTSSRVVPSADSLTDSTSVPLEKDDDKMFLLSLLPYFKKFGDERRLEARLNFTKLLHDMLYKQS